MQDLIVQISYQKQITWKLEKRNWPSIVKSLLEVALQRTEELLLQYCSQAIRVGFIQINEMRCKLRCFKCYVQILNLLIYWHKFAKQFRSRKNVVDEIRLHYFQELCNSQAYEYVIAVLEVFCVETVYITAVTNLLKLSRK